MITFFVADEEKSLIAEITSAIVVLKFPTMSVMER